MCVTACSFSLAPCFSAGPLSLCCSLRPDSPRPSGDGRGESGQAKLCEPPTPGLCPGLINTNRFSKAHLTQTQIRHCIFESVYANTVAPGSKVLLCHQLLKRFFKTK